MHLQVRSPRNLRFRPLNRESMVLRGDEDSAASYVLYRMVPAAMTVRHFRRLGAVCEGENLVPETNTEDGNTGVGDGSNRLRGILDRRRIARAIREKHTVRLQVQHVLCLRFPPNCGEHAVTLRDRV